MKKLLLLAILLVFSCSSDHENQYERPIVIYTDPIDPTPDGNGDNSNSLPEWTSIPDINFENELISQGIDDVVDGRVLTANISSLINLKLEHTNISDATGIENFVSLEFLSMWDNPITTIDVTKNIALKILGLGECPLNTVDLSKNTELIEIDFQGDSSRNNDESYPYGKTLGMTSLDLRHNLKMEKIFIWCNRLTSLDVTMLSNLTTLWLGNSSSGPTGGNYIKRLDLTGNPKLETFIAEGGSYEYIDARGAGASNPWTIMKNVALNRNAALTSVKVSKLAYINQVNTVTNQNATGNIRWRYDAHTILSE